MKFFVLKLSSLKKVVCLFVLLALLCVNLNGGKVAGVFLGQSIRKVPIYAVSTDEKKVAISFDAAWGADKTEEIIKICQEFKVNATFFLVGFWVDEHNDLVEKMVKSGFEVGTHSNTHPDMTKLSAENQSLELKISCEKLEKITNKKVDLFRAPFGAYNNSLIDEAEKLGLKTIQWDVDSLDWKGLSADEITLRILNKVKNGSIILCHNNSEHILEALPMTLDRLIKKGYKVTCVGDLVYENDYVINNQGIQSRTN